MTKVTLPIISQALVDADRRMVKEWYDKLKFLEKLQPLSDIPADPAVVDSIDGETGDFTLGYGVSQTANELAIGFTSISAALGSNVLLNNIANYFDGPSIAQGSTGTWFVTGTVTVIDTGATAAIYAKLWDGTTVIASGAGYSNNLARGVAVTLSGIITAPAGNLRISCRDPDAATGAILFNQTGNSKDSHITAVRIA